MPIYEYLCEDCGTHFEKLLRRTTDEVNCPECGESHLAQQLSRFAARSDGGQAEAFTPACTRGDMCCHGSCGEN